MKNFSGLNMPEIQLIWLLRYDMKLLRQVCFPPTIITRGWIFSLVIRFACEFERTGAE